MPRLSLYRPNRTNDYKFLDNTIREMYTVGGLDLYIHKYLGPKLKNPDSTLDSTLAGDATQPVYDELLPTNIEDLLLGENRTRDYDDDIFSMRGVFNIQDIDFDLTQFGLFLNSDTLFITFHYNDMIDTLGRKLMAGDVLEVPNLRDFHPLDPSIPKAMPRYYVVQDGAYASEGFSATWLPHLWRIKATPMKASQEFDDILNKPFDPDNEGAGSINDFLGTHNKDLEVNQAIIAQAENDVPLSGYDTTKFYILPTTPGGLPGDPNSVTADDLSPTVDATTTESDETSDTPRAEGYTLGYLTGDSSGLLPPNGMPVTPGVTFPVNARQGDYVLRLDYFPNRLFRYDGKRWVYVDSSVRTDLTPGATNQTLKSGFVNNTTTVATSDRGSIPSRQSLSDALKPQADN